MTSSEKTLEQLIKERQLLAVDREIGLKAAVVANWLGVVKSKEHHKYASDEGYSWPEGWYVTCQYIRDALHIDAKSDRLDNGGVRYCSAMITWEQRIVFEGRCSEKEYRHEPNDAKLYIPGSETWEVILEQEYIRAREKEQQASQERQLREQKNKEEIDRKLREKWKL